MANSEEQINIPRGQDIQKKPIKFLLDLNSRREECLYLPGEATCLQGSKGVLVAPRLTHTDDPDHRPSTPDLSRIAGVLMDYVILGLEIAAIRSQLSSLCQGNLTLVCHDETCQDQYVMQFIDQLKALRSTILKGSMLAPLTAGALALPFDAGNPTTPPGFEILVGMLSGTALIGRLNYKTLVEIKDLLKKLESGSFDLKIESELGKVTELSSAGRYDDALVQLGIADNIISQKWLPMAELLAVKSLDNNSTYRSRLMEAYSFISADIKRRLKRA